MFDNGLDIKKPCLKLDLHSEGWKRRQSGCKLLSSGGQGKLSSGDVH
jgi:hypothetical protein